MEKYTTFDNWWTEYVKTSTLNTLHLSFIDVDVLREEMRKAFSRELPMQDAIQPDDSADWLEHYLRELKDFEARSRNAKILVG